MAASALVPSGATAQRAGGEIGVSLTILPPSVLQSVSLADVRIDLERASTRTSPTTRGTPVVTPRLCGDRRGSPGDAVRVVRLRRESFVVSGT